MECVHLKEQLEHRQHIPYTSLHLYSEILEQVIYGKSPNRQVQAYLKLSRCRCVNVLERNGNPHSRYPCLVPLLGIGRRALLTPGSALLKSWKKHYCLMFVYLGEFKGCVWPLFCPCKGEQNWLS
jgi:hypothetical protein